MKKLKITENQRKMLESKGNAKMTNEMDIRPSKSPSFKVSSEFKKDTNGIKGLKTEAENVGLEWRQLVPHVHELIKQMYTKPSKEDMNPFWEENGVSWDEIIHLLTSLDLIKSVKGGYRLTKIVKSPAKAVKIVAKILHKLINDKRIPEPVAEIDSDGVKKSLEKAVEPKTKTGKTRAELLKIIAAKRAEELKRREKEDNGGIEEDKAPSLKGYTGVKILNIFPFSELPETRNQVDWNNRDVKNWGPVSIPSISDEDAMSTVFAKDDVITYIDNFIKKFGEEPLFVLNPTQEWHSKINVINPKFLDWKKKGIETKAALLNKAGTSETTTSAAMGDVPVGPMTTGKQFDSNVKDELGDMISEHDPEQAPYLEQLKSLFNDGKVTPEQWLSYSDDLYPIIKALQQNENYIGIITKVAHMLQIADIMKDMPEIAWKVEGEFVKATHGLKSEIAREKTLPVEETTSTVSAGNYQYTAPAGDGSDFWTAGNKLNKKMNENRAFKDTQWPKGEFVEFDDCTKLNNNKEAQKGGCSVGAADNVVKTKSSKDSVISDSSIYEDVAKATGRTIEEVKAILDNKITKTK